MLHTARAYNGMVVAPHRLAAEAGLRVLRQGGNAVEAAVSAAATLCVVYPHMTGLGGDAFWLILPSGETTPTAIDACGRSAGLASLEWYADKGVSALPHRGPLAALTVAGAVSGWEAALKLANEWPGQPFALNDLFADAVALAEKGFPVSSMQSLITGRYLTELLHVPGFSGQFTRAGKAPETGSRMRLPALACGIGQCLERLRQLNMLERRWQWRSLDEQLKSVERPDRLDDPVKT